MNIADFKRLIRNLTEENVVFDEPHVSLRCEKNGFTTERIKHMLLDPYSNLIRLVEDRPKVFILYYGFNKGDELKIIIDLKTY